MCDRVRGVYTRVIALREKRYRVTEILETDATSRRTHSRDSVVALRSEINQRLKFDLGIRRLADRATATLRNDFVLVASFYSVSIGNARFNNARRLLLYALRIFLLYFTREYV